MRVCAMVGAFALLITALYAAPSEVEVVPEVDFVEAPKPKLKAATKKVPDAGHPKHTGHKEDTGPVTDETQAVIAEEKKMEQFRKRQASQDTMDEDINQAKGMKHSQMALKILETAAAKCDELGFETLHACDMNFCKFQKKCDYDFETDGGKTSCKDKKKEHEIHQEHIKQEAHHQKTNTFKGVLGSKPGLLMVKARIQKHKQSLYDRMEAALNKKQKLIQHHNKAATELAKSPKCKEGWKSLGDKAEKLMAQFSAKCQELGAHADRKFKEFEAKQKAEEEAKEEAALEKALGGANKAEEGEHDEEGNGKKAKKAKNAKKVKPLVVGGVAVSKATEAREEVPQALANASPAVQEEVHHTEKVENMEKQEAGHELKKTLHDLQNNPAKAIAEAKEDVEDSEATRTQLEKEKRQEKNAVTNPGMYEQEVALFEDVIA